MPSIEEILSTLTAAIKEQVRDEVRAELIAELGGTAPKAAKTRGKPGPKPKASTPKKIPAVKAGGRRGQEEIDRAKRGIVKFLRANPGSRVDQIAAEFDGATVKELQLPIAQLLEEKAIIRKGVKRGTTYSVRG